MPAWSCWRATPPTLEALPAIGRRCSRTNRARCGPTTIPTSSASCCARSSAGSVGRLLPWNVGVADHLLPARNLGRDHGSHLAGRAGANLLSHGFELG